jgi:hypothetical protein
MLDYVTPRSFDRGTTHETGYLRGVSRPYRHGEVTPYVAVVWDVAPCNSGTWVTNIEDEPIVVICWVENDSYERKSENMVPYFIATK